MVNGVVDAAIDAVALVLLAARPARLAAAPPRPDPPPAAAAVVPAALVRRRGQHRRRVVAGAAPADQGGVDGLEGEREARLHREEPQPEGDRGHRPETEVMFPLLLLCC